MLSPYQYMSKNKIKISLDCPFKHSYLRLDKGGADPSSSLLGGGGVGVTLRNQKTLWIPPQQQLTFHPWFLAGRDISLLASHKYRKGIFIAHFPLSKGTVSRDLLVIQTWPALFKEQCVRSKIFWKLTTCDRIQVILLDQDGQIYQLIRRHLLEGRGGRRCFFAVSRLRALSQKRARKREEKTAQKSESAERGRKKAWNCAFSSLQHLRSSSQDQSLSARGKARVLSKLYSTTHSMLNIITLFKSETEEKRG